MAIDLLKRSELARGLTNAEQDGNLTALETHINAILTGTSGYQAGDSLKLAGVLASLFWNNNNCPKLLAANGWQKLASGLIIQWGSAAVVNAGTVVTFPIVFPTACFVVVPTVNDPIVWTAWVAAMSPTTTTLKQSYTGGPLIVLWFALGY